MFENTQLAIKTPIAMPADAGTGEPPKQYSWDENSVNWIEVQNGN
jgi:hypothetical protein